MTLLRSLIFFVWFYGVTIALALAAPIVRPRGWRPAIGYARLWSRLVLGGLNRICGIRYEVSGREHLRARGPVLIASMHQSAFETFAWLQIEPTVTYVVKEELARVPIIGGLMREAGLIVVDREAGPSAMRHAIVDAKAAVVAGRPIVIFPEGTRVPPGKQVKLHPGVAGIAGATGLEVVPVATDSGLFWGRHSFLKRSGVVHIAIMRPIPAGTPRAELMRRLAEAFAEGSAALGVPVENSVGVAPARLAGKSRSAE